MEAFEPDWVSVPGDTIIDILQEKNISNEDFVSRMSQSADYVHGLMYGRVIISDEVAVRLSQVLGASKQFWLNRQCQYQQSLIKINNLTDSKWLEDIPFGDMVKLGWINKSKNKLEVALNFFGVNDISEWASAYNYKIGESFSFRTSSSFNSKLGPLSCWLRRGEIVGQKIQCNNWNAKKFEQSLPIIKLLTREKDPLKYVPALQSICADCGVAVAIVKAPSGCRASGSATFMSSTKALIILSFRHLSDDQFWFTFFHEAGHLLLHANKSEGFFVDGIDNNEEYGVKDNRQDAEDEANEFAEEWLIKKELRNEMVNMRRDKRTIISFSQKAGVSAGIVIGQMQHFGYIKKDYLNSYKRRYTWDGLKPILM